MPSKIYMKPRLSMMIQEEFGIPKEVMMTRFMGIPVEVLHEGNGNMFVLEE